jgi:hypothetical protein
MIWPRFKRELLGTPVDQAAKVSEEIREFQMAMAAWKRRPIKATRRHVLLELMDIDQALSNMVRVFREDTWLCAGYSADVHRLKGARLSPMSIDESAHALKKAIDSMTLFLTTADMSGRLTRQSARDLVSAEYYLSILEHAVEREFEVDSFERSSVADEVIERCAGRYEDD